MEHKTEFNFEISPSDIEFVKNYIKPIHSPVRFEDVAYQLALFKTQETRKKQVKLYNPECEYGVGDLIYKEYPGKLPVGSKKFIDIPEGVILKVEEIRSRFGHNEILLSYDGTSDFRKYIEYLTRQKIDLLLPHKQGKLPVEPKLLSADIDPRSQQAPLVERDYSQLKKKLVIALNKESDLVFLSNMILLKDNLKQIKPEVFESIKQFLRTHQHSEKTEFFVENFIHVEPGSPDFDAYCFSLNHHLFLNYKIDLQQTEAIGWGKWHLISVLYQMKKNALINDPNPLLSSIQFKNNKNYVQKKKWLEDSIFIEGENRYFLTQREIVSGAIRLRAPLVGITDSIELEIVDSVSKKTHTAYYYQKESLLLGLEKIYESYRAVQGTIIFLEYDENQRLCFTIKTTKKGVITEKIDYIPEGKIFRVSEEKVASSVLVNKSIFLEPEVFHTVENHLDEFRRSESYSKLMHKVFLEFGIRERNFEIHLLRLYHILDLIFPIDLTMIEEIVLSNPEFIPSEKIAGVFYLDSDAVTEIEEEEKKRRQSLIEESKRKREELRRQQQEEEQKKKEEIRQLREERKKKREDEMRLVEGMRMDKMHPKEEPASIVPPSKRMARADVSPQAQTKKAESELPPQDLGVEKSEPAKRTRKRIEPEKPIKTAKKGQKKILEEKIELSEIKKEILTEEINLQDEEAKKEKKESVKEINVAYQDQGGFGGVFASKLDELVEKEKEEPEKPKKKNKK